jgi:N-acyl-D-amino-acid deacylase
MFDAMIKGGTIIDGTGNVGFKGDVAIEGKRLKILVGDTSSVKATNIIDASGCVVVPGFIDVHTHSDLIALSEPLNEPKIRQGVTTDMLGLDGMGYAPLSNKNLEMMLLDWSGVSGCPKLDYNWSSVAEYRQQFNHKTSINVAYLIPNSCLRAETVGWEDRPATKEEIRAMQDMIRQGMTEGAVGLSTGLSYPPGIYASTEELIALCQTVVECGGVYVTHVRHDLGDGPFDGFREAVTIGAHSGCPVHFSHYATSDTTHGQTAELLQIVDDARAMGVDLTFDSYPWDAGSSYLAIVVSSWAHNGGPYELLKRLKNKDDRSKMRSEFTETARSVEKIVISAVKTERNKWCQGLTVAAVAERLNKAPWDVMCDLLIEEDLEVAFWERRGDMNDVKVIMTHPAHMFITDGLRIGDMPNPRTYGTYPKILGQLVRDEKILTMEQAIRKMTSFPAQRFGLTSRGILRDGMKADIVVFNPVTVNSTATFTHPKQFPLGIEYVFVNGEMVVEKGRHTGALPGEPLPS